ncbi:hypothetical protein [Ilumatobacter sp.]|uniref:hypothetical protein n=1 Tax=Ilumatobacter sp. TaxID=1967498 RepID=UPI003AF7E549
MQWFLNNTDMLEAMSEIAGDPDKLAAFKESPADYLEKNTSLNEEEKSSILSQNHETMLRALMSHVDDES